MKRDAITVVKDIVKDEVDFIECEVVSVDIPTRRARVRPSGSSHTMLVNLGAIDPDWVLDGRARLLVYISPFGGMYATSTIGDKPTAASKPAVTLGDKHGACKWQVLNSDREPIFAVDSLGRVTFTGSYITYNWVPGPGGVTDHGNLDGLSHDDHTQYTEHAGAESITGLWTFKSNVNADSGITFDGVDISDHASRHNPNATDAIDTAAPVTNVSSSSQNLEGAASNVARSDHSHAIGSMVTFGTAEPPSPFVGMLWVNTASDPGVTAIPFDYASISISGQAISASTTTGISLSAASSTSAGQAISIAGGTAAITLNASSVSAMGQAASVTAGTLPISITLYNASMSATGQSITVSAAVSYIIDIDHEAGNLSEYDSTQTDSGDLSVTAGAALNSTSYGLSCLVDDTNAIYGQANISSSTGTFRARFYIDPNSMSINNNAYISVFRVLDNVSRSAAEVLLAGTPTGYEMRVWLYDDTGTPNIQTATITDAEHYIEIRVERATNSSSSDGYLDWWIDGSAKTSITGIDNYDRFPNVTYVRLGANSFAGSSSGTFYLDELVANEDGTEIGA